MSGLLPSSRTTSPGGMNPHIIDKDTGVELWTVAECAEFTGTARGTFTSYAGRGKAPVPAAKLHGLNPRNSDDVREWQKGHEAKGK